MPKAKVSLAPLSKSDRDGLLCVVREADEPLEATKVVKFAQTSRLVTASEALAVLQEFAAEGLLNVWPAKTAKGKPRFWDRDLKSVGSTGLADLVKATAEPISAKDVKKLWKSPFKLTDTEIASILHELVNRGVIHEIPAKTASSGVRYWNRDAKEFARHSLLLQLRNQPPQTKTKLKGVVKWLDSSQFDDLISQLTNGGEIFLHPPLSKSKTAQPLWGHSPPSPTPYLKAIGEQLAVVVKQLQSVSVPQAELRRAAVQMLEAAGISFGANTPVAAEGSPVSVEETIDLVKLMRTVEPGADRGALVPTRILRAAAKMPKAAFDSLALKLSREGKIVLHEHDFVASLSPQAREELVTDGQGNYYVGMAIRARQGR